MREKKIIIDSLQGFATDLVDCIANATFSVSSGDNPNTTTITEHSVEPVKTAEDSSKEKGENKENSSESYSYWSWIPYWTWMMGASQNSTAPTSQESLSLLPLEKTSPDSAFEGSSELSHKITEDGAQQKNASQALIEIFQIANKKYSNEDSYWSWISMFFRVRSFEKTIKDLENFPDPILRLQAFKEFISQGTWNIESANTLLIISAIRAIPGYENDEQNVTNYFIHETIIPSLKRLLFKEIDKRIEARAEFLKQQEEERRKIEEICQDNLKLTAGIELFDNAEEAKKAAIANPSKLVFHLSARKLTKKEIELRVKKASDNKQSTSIDENQLIWQLTWYDLTGNAITLQIRSGIEELLTSFQLALLPEENLSHNSTTQYDIKLKLSEFAKWVSEYQERKSVILNPSPEELKGLRSTYVIAKNEKEFHLTWYDDLGVPTVLKISDYFLLAEWLKTKTDLTKDDLLFLKIYLQPQLANPEFSIKVQCGKTVEEHLERIKVLLNPTTLQLQNLTLTYVLQQENGYSLTWYDSLGKPYPVNLDNYQLLSDWLNTKPQLTKEDIPQLKTYIQHVQVRNEFNQSTQKSLHKKMEEERGINLICSDNLQLIPSFRLTSGVYLLTREPDAKTGEWVLYQRQKDKTNIRINIDAEGTMDWGKFNAFLAGKNAPFSATQLTVEDRKELCKIIIANFSAPKEVILCRAIKDFAPEKAKEYKPAISPASFVICKKGSDWQLFYIDFLQKAIAVSLTQVKGLPTLLTKWDKEDSEKALKEAQPEVGSESLNEAQPKEGSQSLNEALPKVNPEWLSQERLKEISQLLVDFKPANHRMAISAFSMIEACLKKPNRVIKPSTTEVISKAPLESEEVLEVDIASSGADFSDGSESGEFTVSATDGTVGSSSGRKIGKLNLNNYSSVTTTFNHRLKEKTPQDLIQENSLPIPATSPAIPNPHFKNLDSEDVAEKLIASDVNFSVSAELGEVSTSALIEKITDAAESRSLSSTRQNPEEINLSDYSSLTTVFKSIPKETKSMNTELKERTSEDHEPKDTESEELIQGMGLNN